MENVSMAKTSAAALRAQDRYKKANIVNVALQFNKKTEPDLTEYVRALPNKTGYIKGLIRKDAHLDQQVEHWVLRINDEDEVRDYPIHANTEASAIAEAKEIVSLFDGWLKGRIDKSDWQVVNVSNEEANPIYLFR